MDGDLYARVFGQQRAVAALRSAALRPVHAYLLLGPPGAGKEEAAVSFAAALLCPTGGIHDGDLCDSCRRVLSGLHPDLVVVEREGATISIDTARAVTRAATTSPVEGGRKVIVIHELHLVRDTGPALLKTLEEPPPSTVFVVLADHLPAELVTIASRCLTVTFDALGPAEITSALVADGTEPERAAELALAAGGRLDRARLLASDPQFDKRRRTWREVVSRLDGTGSTVAALADELIEQIEASVEALKGRQAAEMEQLIRRNERAAEVVGTGRKGSGRGRAARGGAGPGVRELEERHRRELRRQRTDELRSGLSVLAGAFRDRLGTGSSGDVRRRRQSVQAVQLVDDTARRLEFNPGEALALQALLARLGRLAGS